MDRSTITSRYLEALGLPSMPLSLATVGEIIRRHLRQRRVGIRAGRANRVHRRHRFRPRAFRCRR